MSIEVLSADLPPDAPGGAIVYCATRRETEALAAFLREKGWRPPTSTPGCKPESKKSVQERSSAATWVIVATNAFGMGIDKPDVRLVIHADIPARWKTTCRRPAAPGGTGRRRAACFSTRLRTWKGSSACRPDRA